MNLAFKLVLLGLMLPSVFVSSYADEQEEVKTLVDSVFSIAKAEKNLFKSKNKIEMDNKFNFDKMALTILGEEAKKRSESDKQWFSSSIKEIITRTVYPRAYNFFNQVKISYRKTLIESNKALIFSNVSKKGDVSEVIYVLNKSEGQSSDKWKIVDISIDDESWVQTIHEKLQKSLQEKGWPGVVQMINKRVNELKKSTN